MDLPQNCRRGRMIQLVLTTFPDAEQARRAAHQLVTAQLAACGTVLPAATSIYIWNGALEETSECLLLLKTTAECVNDLQLELLKIHPYEVPEILSFTANFSHAPYAEWVARQCGHE
jgi:periplasmic divalent cation tolerance protein